MSRHPSEESVDKERAEEDLLEAFAEAIAEALSPTSIDQEELADLRARVLSSTTASSHALTETIRGDEIGWQESWPRVWMKVLKRDISSGIQFALFRLEAGAIMPEHAHTKDEECIVIEGDLAIGPLFLQAGDLHVAYPGARHPPITTRRGALVFVRSEIRVPAA